MAIKSTKNNSEDNWLKLDGADKTNLGKQLFGNASSVMFQGTGSDVGKSLIVAGICRALKNRNIKVAPFKPQNMSNNAGIAKGGEIGRAQVLQAKAAKTTPTVLMNPVLLKPQSDFAAQIIVGGEVVDKSSENYFKTIKPKLLKYVIESFRKLKKNYEFIVVEGAGSPAEINLRDGDIANMGFASIEKTPVILVVDVDRGGSIASVVGTMQVLSDDDSKLIKGYIINKFRGQKKLYNQAILEIGKRSNLTCFGIIPWFEKASLLPAEDAVCLQRDFEMEGKFNNNGKKQKTKKINIVVLKIPYIANFDDIDPLALEKDVSIKFLKAGEVIAQGVDLILLLGSKSTCNDTVFLKKQGWHIDILAHVRRGGYVMGICAGFQMLGQSISDENLIEGKIKKVEGLGLFKMKTVLKKQKNLTQVNGKVVFKNNKTANITGYKMHMGVSTGIDLNNPFATLDEFGNDGAVSKNGLIIGTYIHGIFNNDEFRNEFLNKFRKNNMKQKVKNENYLYKLDKTLDELAQHLEKNLKIDEIIKIAKKSSGNIKL